MNGLGSLMQGAAPQGPQQGMPQGQQGMPMPPANDPRMAAAMDVVEADIPESLQQVVSEKEFADKAKELLMSAGGQAAMNQTPPTPPTVAERVGQKAEEGVAGLLARLSPGIQQQGQQMARAQQRPPMQGQRPPMQGQRPPMQGQRPPMQGQRPPMQGQRPPMQGQRPPMQGQRPPMQGQRPPMPQQGMAGMPARNMQGMARGGVIGYAGPDGSQVKPTPGAMPQNVLSSDQIKQDAAMYQQLKAGLAAAKTPEGKARVQMQLDALIRDMGNEHGKVMQYIDSTKGFVHPRSQMAGGGIIGYAPGGDVEGESIRERRIRREFEDGQQYLDRQRRNKSEQARQGRLNRLYAELNNPEITSEESAALTLELEQLRASQSLDAVEPGGITELKQSQFKTDTRSPQLRPFPQRPSSLIDDSSVGIATGGAAQDTFDPPVGATTAPPFTSVIGDATEAQILAAFGADANAAATTRGDRARELMGLEGLMAERKALQGEARGLREERFSPERMKKRTWRAGLASLGEKGLGGFGSGATTERDKIDAERAAAAGISIDEMNSLITELRAMGMTQFEAENKARDVVETRATSAISAGTTLVAEQSRADQDQRNREAAAERDRLNRESNLDIAKLNALRPTDFMNEIKIRVDALQASNSALSDVDARSQALEARIEDQARAQLAAAGIRADSLDLDRLKAAYSMAGAKLANRFDLIADSEAFNTAFREEVKNIMAEFGTPSTDESSTGPAVGAVRDGFRFKGGDPNVRSNWEEI